VLNITYPLSERTLDNGLRVIINSDLSAPAVAVNLWYAVGSGDEQPTASGFAHLFEHLMFSGTAQVAAGEHLAAIEAVGGQVNATTNMDRTNYFETVPPHAVELALWLEAERMRSLAVTSSNLDTQREVVKEEKRQRIDNVPYGDLFGLLLRHNFPTNHPYGHDTIGEMADLDAASIDMVREFYERWYRPDNATLVLCGAISAADGFRLADHYFAAVRNPATPRGVRKNTGVLPPHENVPHATVERAVPLPDLSLSWRVPPIGTPDDSVLDVIAALLTAGQSGRLYRTLVREHQVADSIATFGLGLARGGSLFVISGRPRPNHSTTEMTDMILNQLNDLATNGPRENELERVLANVERVAFTSLAPVDERADAINAAALLLGDPARVNSRLTEVMQVSAADVSRVAATWLAPEHRAVFMCLATEASPYASAMLAPQVATKVETHPAQQETI
jgi:predicted Zn-dependent peptidase